MTSNQSYNLGHAIFFACGLLLAMSSGRVAHAEAAQSADNAYLDALLGIRSLNAAAAARGISVRAEDTQPECGRDRLCS